MISILFAILGGLIVFFIIFGVSFAFKTYNIKKARLLQKLGNISLGIGITLLVATVILVANLKTIYLKPEKYDLQTLAQTYDAREVDTKSLEELRYMKLWGMEEYTYYRPEPTVVDKFTDFKIEE